MKKVSILIVDDDDLFLWMTKESLKGADFLKNVLLEANPDKALEKLDQWAHSDDNFPDFIFVDYHLADMDGIEFAKRFQQDYARLHPETRLFLLTSSVSEKEEELALSVPIIQDILIKPLSQEKLQKTLTEV